MIRRRDVTKLFTVLVVALAMVAPNAIAQSAPDASAAPDPTSTTQPGAPADSTTTPPAPAPTVAVLDAAPLGVDPSAGTYVTGVLRSAATGAGHVLVATDVLYAAARDLRLPFPIPADGLHALTNVLHVSRALTADVRAGGGYYVVRVRVRFANESSERSREIVATQWTLGDALRAVVPVLLSAEQASVDTPAVDNGAALLPDMSDYRPPPPRRPVRLHPQRFELAAGLDFIVGPGADPFFNFVAFGRIAWFPWDRFGLSLSFGYANLRGRVTPSFDVPNPMSRETRVNNVIFGFGVETAVEIAPRPRIYLPIRAEIAYLPFNGPVLRATGGLGFTLARNVRLELDLLSLAVWLMPESTPVSINFGAQISVGLGATPRRSPRPAAPASRP